MNYIRMSYKLYKYLKKPDYIKLKQKTYDFRQINIKEKETCKLN